MTNQFIHRRSCRWHDCGRRFDGNSPCGSYSNHVTDHLKQMQTPQCLWNGCFQTFRLVGSLAHHVSAEHRVPNDWTMLTEMHYRIRARDARSRVMPAEHQNTLTQRRGYCNTHNSYYRDIFWWSDCAYDIKQPLLLVFMWKLDRAATAVHLRWSSPSR
jgi:hypothetical protein